MNNIKKEKMCIRIVNLWLDICNDYYDEQGYARHKGINYQQLREVGIVFDTEGKETTNE